MVSVSPESLAERLREGERILVHCSGGVGRSGTLAVSVLLVLGLEPELAHHIVKESGSQPETGEQREIIR